MYGSEAQQTITWVKQLSVASCRKEASAISKDKVKSPTPPKDGGMGHPGSVVSCWKEAVSHQLSAVSKDSVKSPSPMNCGWRIPLNPTEGLSGAPRMGHP